MSNSDPKESVVIGVDVGGTKIATALVDLRGNILRETRHPTDVSNPQATLDGIAQAIDHIISSSGFARADIVGIGLGIPGLVDPVNGIGIASVNLNWRNVPVKAELERRLSIPCAIENDVKAAALGEARYGAGRGMKNLIYMTIGTGIAVAFVLDNEIYSGSKGMAGEVGHAIIERDGPLCKCGGHGCLEALAAGPAIAARAANKLQAGRPSILSQLPTDSLTAEDIFHAATQQDELALETVKEAGYYLAFAIQFLALAYDPQVVVLGGGVPQAGEVFLRPVRQSLEHLAAENWVFGELYHPDFVQVTKLGTDIAVLGAAALVAPTH